MQENIGIGRLRQKEQAEAAGKRLMEDDAQTPPSATSHDVRAPSNPPSSSSSKPSLSLASLPTSFTTLLLSVLDSPAYANLTSTYLNTIFNPATPDHPNVKYFSVAGRIANMSVWHPLWVPKMVRDGFEERERERLRREGSPLWRRDEAWGNDGLVTVQSARWGEFLGSLEGCDHWDLRGARGIDVDLPSISVPGLGGGKPKDEGGKTDADGWSLADWGKFVRAWKKEERDAAKSAGAGISEQKRREGEEMRGAREAMRDKEHADEVVKSSTDKLSAVFDWLVEQVPSPKTIAALSPAAKASPDRDMAPKPSTSSSREKSRKQAERNELETKMDLERFYVALCRKLYDEGL